jgi:hypothetical protein
MIITNVSVGGRYSSGAERLKKSLKEVHWDGSVKTWVEEYPPGCPAHQQLNYGFKSHAIKNGRDMGHDIVIWLDSSIVLLEPLDRFIEQIKRDGYCLFLNGWTAGEWMTDISLSEMGVSRDNACKMKNMIGGIMGFDFTKDISQRFFDIYYKFAQNPNVMNGSWTNKNKECSSDPRCLGHRHDQSMGSVIMDQLGMTLTLPQGWLEYYPATRGDNMFLVKCA